MFFLLLQKNFLITFILPKSRQNSNWYYFYLGNSNYCNSFFVPFSVVIKQTSHDFFHGLGNYYYTIEISKTNFHNTKILIYKNDRERAVSGINYINKNVDWGGGIEFHQKCTTQTCQIGAVLTNMA